MGYMSLLKDGLLNYQSSDLRDLIKEPSEIRAYCTSIHCTKILGKRVIASIHKENVGRNKTSCPDCGHSLIWKRRKTIL